MSNLKVISICPTDCSKAYFTQKINVFLQIKKNHINVEKLLQGRFRITSAFVKNHIGRSSNVQ